MKAMRSQLVRADIRRSHTGELSFSGINRILRRQSASKRASSQA